MLFKLIRASIIAAVLGLFVAASAKAQPGLASTALTYQGALTQDGSPAFGPFDLTFQLFSDPVAGTNVSLALTNTAIAVSNGLFTTTLDFGGAVFNGEALWLEIGVQTNGGSNSFVILSPRQAVTATPYAITAASAGTLTGILPATALSGRYTGTVNFSGTGNLFSGRFIGNGATLSNVNANALGGVSSSGFWQTGGNAGTVATSYLGSSDNQPLALRVFGARALLLAPTATTPNFIAGAEANAVGSNVVGAAIGGGGTASSSNVVSESFATIGGGKGNSGASLGGTISGGYQGFVAGFNATVGGGLQNSATADYSTVSGGTRGAATAANATVAGGLHNIASGASASVSGGSGNTASGQAGAVGGGTSNAATGPNAATGGGAANTASGGSSAVVGGTGNIAAGTNSVVAGGANNNAAGASSLAAGAFASAAHDNSFVWSDGADGATVLATTGTNQFIARASGGFWLYSSGNNASGVALPPGGGSWSSLSDRNSKTNFAPVDERELLERLDAVPISFWSYKSQDASIRHVGPMAQDLYAAFGLGEDNRRITAVDSEGLALAAAQGLHSLARQQELSIESLRDTARRQEAELAARARQIETLEKRLAELEEAVRSSRPRAGEKAN
jgi:hypothetical protein